MIKTRRTKRTFSPEFKLEAIEQMVKYVNAKIITLTVLYHWR
ncbi:IS602 transposase [Escherichia coli]|nr:IS602 transposase [Escherichia coli]